MDSTITSPFEQFEKWDSPSPIPATLTKIFPQSRIQAKPLSSKF